MNILGVSLILLASVCWAGAQEKNIVERETDWRWITLLKTHRDEIEKVYGEPITEDKSRMYQTYVTEFGKVNIAYIQKKEHLEICNCTVTAGTVYDVYLSFGILLRPGELGYDLTKFKYDKIFYPREMSYYDADSGIYIGTEMVRLRNGDYVERVFTISYSPVKSLFNKPN